MKTKTFILTISILVALISCKKADAPAEASPISTFDSPFPKNNKQLSRIFGSILLIRNNGDTLTLKITSTKTDNLITDGKSGDTIFFGKVCKYRDFYYFNHKVNDTSYYISAFQIKGNLIFGLNRWSQYFDVDENAINGNCKELVKSINADTSAVRLHPNKKELKKLFTTIMNRAIPDTILNSNTDLNAIAKRESSLEKEQDEADNYLKVYPNPATDFITVELNRKSFFQLTDFNGKVSLQGKLNELTNKIDISNKHSGIYFLTISNLEKAEKQTVKIIIK